MKQKSLYLMTFIRNFYHLYPDMETKDLYLAGQLNAGTLLPYLSFNILDYNSKSKAQIPLRGAIIGNPIASPLIQQLNQHLLPQGLNIANDLNLDQIAILEQHCQDANFRSQSYQGERCSRIEDYIAMISGDVIP